MTKAALYARYSSENQKDTSIDQQLRLLMQRVEAEGWEIAGVYQDKALSGANMMRPGLQAMLSAAFDQQFDIVLTESIDRLSRDQEDIAHMHKRLRFRNIAIVSLMEGEISELHIGLKGTMSALYLQDLSRRVHRGQKERAINGESTGGKSYGYDINPRYDARGNRISGERVINDHQAAIVRRIFEDYAKGKSPKKIATELNAEGVAAQGGRTWAASTINGNRRRGTGILNNELYIGVQIWGKQSFIKDPDTGRENGRLNDESKWIRTEVPHLRIVSDELWQAVKSHQRQLDEKPNYTAKRRPERLLSFLLKCGCCGGGFSMISATHYGCSARRNKGTCSNRLTISETRLQNIVLGALRTKLMDPELTKVFCDEYTKHLNRVRMDHNTSLVAAKAELEKVERGIAKLVEAIKSGVDPVLIRDEINGLQQRKLALQETLKDKKEAPVYVHPNMSLRYQQEVQRLLISLNDVEHRAESAKLIRQLIDKIVLTPNGDDSALTVDLHGDLAGILRASAGKLKEDFGKGSGVRSASELNELQQVRLLAGDASASDSSVDQHRRRWLGWQDSNLRMPVPKTGALPLGDTPMPSWPMPCWPMPCCTRLPGEEPGSAGAAYIRKTLFPPSAFLKPLDRVKAAQPMRWTQPCGSAASPR